MTFGKRQTVLLVDDSKLNMHVMTESLMGYEWDVLTASNGKLAWEMLCDVHKIDVVVLDRMMPEMDGMTLLKLMKSTPKLADIPVVLQTGAASGEKMTEGLEAGAYYYLTKPFDASFFRSVIRNALREKAERETLRVRMEAGEHSLDFLSAGIFVIRKLDEARCLSGVLSRCCPRQEEIVIGLNEILVNAVEHGNLGITYAEKTLLNEKDGEWEREVRRRETLPENLHKKVTVRVVKTLDKVEFNVKDDGNGFDWQAYMSITEERMFDNHGRGIAIAVASAFDEVIYSGRGNEVKLVVNIPPTR